MRSDKFIVAKNRVPCVKICSDELTIDLLQKLQKKYHDQLEVSYDETNSCTLIYSLKESVNSGLVRFAMNFLAKHTTTTYTLLKI